MFLVELCPTPELFELSPCFLNAATWRWVAEMKPANHRDKVPRWNTLDEEGDEACGAFSGSGEVHEGPPLSPSAVIYPLPKSKSKKRSPIGSRSVKRSISLGPDCSGTSLSQECCRICNGISIMMLICTCKSYACNN